MPAEKTMNEVLATRAVAAVCRVVPELTPETARPLIVQVMHSAELFRSLVVERNNTFDVAGLRYYLRALEAEHGKQPNIARSFALGDALFRAMNGD